jgi:glycosyltransferase involved in cell wall biosynthesis
MLVSVVIPSFNAEAWIAETLRSVQAQTYRPLEIILVDDGSTDQTAAIAEHVLRTGSIAYKIIKQTNSGAATARNVGWQASRGEWIQFLDADDLLEPEKIDAQVAVALEGAESDVIYSDWQKLALVDGAWRGHDIRSPVIQPDSMPDILADRHFLQLGSVLVKTAAVRRVDGFDAAHEPIEDVGFYLKIAMSGGRFIKAAYEKPLAHYRDLPRSFSKRSQTRFIESCIKNARLAERYVRENNEYSPRLIDAIANAYFLSARYFAEYDWKRFEQLAQDIEMIKPKFVPQSPRRLRLISRVTGYKNAERLALGYRKSKRAVLRLCRSVNQRLPSVP